MKQHSVELKAGVVHLPAEFREVARIANQAGLDGLKLIDVSVGPDTQGLVWRTEVRLTFEEHIDREARA